MLQSLGSKRARHDLATGLKGSSIFSVTEHLKKKWTNPKDYIEVEKSFHYIPALPKVLSFCNDIFIAFFLTFGPICCYEHTLPLGS